MEIRPKQPSTKGPAEMFTGDVWIDPIADGQAPSGVRVSAVRFNPGARSAWHSHSLGQTLYVTEGSGLAQTRGGAIMRIRSGDVVVTPADEEHWHGATPEDFMTHLSVTQSGGDGAEPEVEWGMHVTNAEYQGHI
jgi:quercetin dioxygenase-like cupin family protein